MKWDRFSKSVKIGGGTLLSLGAIVVVYSVGDRLGYIFPIALWQEVICNECPKQIPYHQLPPENGLITTNKSIAKLLGDRVDKQRISILIEKSKYRLTIYHDKRPIKSYPIVLGDNPTGDKLIDTQVNWTWGCISIKTADVDAVYRVARAGTLVEIIP